MFETGYTRADPHTGRTVRVIEGDADTSFMGYTLEVREPPQQKPSLAANMHRQWRESFEIIEGIAHYKLGDELKTAVAGETVVIPTTAFHVNCYNGGDTDDE